MFVEPYGRDEVSTVPEGALGKLVRLLLYPCGRLTLEYVDGIGHRILRWHGDVEMDMVVAHMPRVDDESLPFCDLFEYPFQFLFNEFVAQHLASVLGSPDKVVHAHVRAM